MRREGRLVGVVIVPNRFIGLRVDADPPVPNEAAAGSLGGGNVQPVRGPITVTEGAEDAGTGGTASGTTVSVSADLCLPVLVVCPPESVFAWLVAVYEDGRFLGYLRLPSTYRPASDSLVVTFPLGALEGRLLLPACIGPSWVMNHDADVHIWSGPTGGAVDFGVAAPQWTRMTVVGSQVDQRIYVFNPFTADYGWIDAAGVGPVGPPP